MYLRLFNLYGLLSGAPSAYFHGVALYGASSTLGKNFPLARETPPTAGVLDFTVSSTTRQTCRPGRISLKLWPIPNRVR